MNPVGTINPVFSPNLNQNEYNYGGWGMYSFYYKLMKWHSNTMCFPLLLHLFTNNKHFDTHTILLIIILLLFFFFLRTYRGDNNCIQNLFTFQYFQCQYHYKITNEYIYCGNCFEQMLSNLTKVILLEIYWMLRLVILHQL